MGSDSVAVNIDEVPSLITKYQHVDIFYLYSICYYWS